jgi:hypothetical protein
MTSAMVIHRRGGEAVSPIAPAAIAALLLAALAIPSSHPASHLSVSVPAVPHARTVVAAPDSAAQRPARPGLDAPANASSAPAQPAPSISAGQPRADTVGNSPQIMSGDEGVGRSHCLRPKGCR